MAKYSNKNRNIAADEVAEEVVNDVVNDVAEETAEQTTESEPAEQEETAVEETVTPEIHVDLAQEEDHTAETVVTQEEKTDGRPQVEVVCDQLYFRPEPNKKGTPIAVLQKGAKLTLIESEDKLPEGWVEVELKKTRGYVMSEFVKRV